ncbi:ABC transporter permease [Virgibacillus siamensis]|uniref:ABC transporter permease n=1 Tax=Virgibacillus siamensis TaxID=480071 RepID=A0ABP3RE15_9BACI
MTFRRFAFNNVIRNKRLYAAYFLSSMFTVMVFFTFAVFAFHPVLSGSGMSGYVKYGMYTASAIIYIFSYFFVLYSMSSFLQSRKKEFGLLMMQGMSIRQIRSMVFLENMLIGLTATVGGIILGLVFAKVILLIAEKVLIIEKTLHFYFPVQAIILTLVSFIVLFFFISLFVSYVLRSRKLINLIKGKQQSKGEPRANIFLTVLSVLLLGLGYTAALLVKGLSVVIAMVPVIIVVIIGTYLLFTQLSVYLIRMLKKRDSIFLHKTNILLLSDLSFRMKDNARTFFLVAIISTVAFSAIGTLFGFQSFLTTEMKDMNPNTLTYMANDQEKQDVALINDTLRERNIETEQEHLMLHYYKIGNDDEVLVVKESAFNRFAGLIDEEPIDLEKGQLKVVEFAGVAFSQSDELLNKTVKLKTGSLLEPKELVSSRALSPEDTYYVVSNKDFAALPAPVRKESYYAWQATDGKQHIMGAMEKLYGQISSAELTSRQYEVYRLNKMFGPVMFVGLFIGVVFFVSAGSFLYFRLYTDLDDDKQKFQSIAKMGLTGKELKKVLNRQTFILFFAPVLVALIHGAVALTALSHLFYYNLFLESVLVLSAFLIIQIIYFYIVRFYYTRQLEAAIG